MDPFDKIPEKIAIFITAQLYRALPPPADDRPEAREARDVIAMAAIAKLGPVNAAEATLAVHAVAAQAHATDCLVAINENRDDFRRAGQCRAQSALMMRQAVQTLRELRELQECRIATFARRAAEIEAERRQVEAEAEERAQAEREHAAAAQAESAPTEPQPAHDAESSHDTTQSANTRDHETRTGLAPVAPRRRALESARIVTLPPGIVRPNGQQPDLTGRMAGSPA